MKKIVQCIIGLLVAQTPLQAATTISTPTVSGVWNIAGSPYTVTVPIEVLAGQTLRIDAGVIVRFSPEAKIDVSGTLIARGTATQQILFRATDTTGWHNDNTTAGGWSGIHYKMLSGAADSSLFTYCTVQDCKYGFSTALNYRNPFSAERSLKITHCTFQHNTSGTGMVGSGPVINLVTYTNTDSIDFSYCTVGYNKAITAIAYGTNMNGFTAYNRNRFHHNDFGSIIRAQLASAVITNNEIDSNNLIYDGSPIYIGGDAIINGNKIHHNVFDKYGAMHCEYGTMDIDNNLVCNNRETDVTSCSALWCSSGIRLDSIAPYPTYYRFRNNVIANNNSVTGGSALAITACRADVMNNTIVNNNSSGVHRPITVTDNVLDPTAEVRMKNNIIISPSWTASSGTLDSSHLILLHGIKKFEFDNNFTPYSFSKTVYSFFTYTLVGDTAHNVIAANPMFVASTPDNLYTTDALTANFGLLSASPCVNTGSITGASHTATDFMGANRVNGSAIDIGAIEYYNNTGINWAEGASLMFTLSPNPANSYVTLKLEAPGVIMLADITGKILLTTVKDAGDSRLAIDGMAPGTYLITYAGAGKMQTQKLIVQ